MKIKEKLSQHRRDFIAVFECESCGHTERLNGYDDTYFHETVIPEMECKECSKKSPDNYEPEKTKYPDGMSV